MKSDNPHSGVYEADTSRTLDGNGGNPTCNQGGIAIVQGFDGYNATETGDKSATLGVNCGMSTGRNGVCIVDPVGGQAERGWEGDVSPTLMARDYKDPTCVEFYDTQSRTYIVRRLTPTECARLQGFPDKWGHVDPKTELTDDEYRFWLEIRKTHDAINGRTVKDYNEKQMLTWYNKLWTDSAEYKMWGNGIALPCALFVLQGIQDALVDEQANRSKWLDDLLRR